MTRYVIKQPSKGFGESREDAYLQEEKGLSRAAAYALHRVAIDLNITRRVDGNGGVHAMLPKDLFK